jgi:Flp pilus assembly protein TadD
VKEKDDGIDRIISLFNKGLFSEAKKIALELLQKHKKNIKLLNLLAAIYAQEGNLQSAKEVYQRAIDIDENIYYTYTNLSLIYKEEYDFVKAREFQEKAIKLNDKDATVYMNLGSILQEEKKYKEAESIYKKSLALKNSSKTIYFNLAKLYMETNRFLEAKEMFEEALKRAPYDSNILFEYSLLYLKFKQYKVGFELYKNRYTDNKIEKQTHLISKDRLLDRGYYTKEKKLLITDEQGFGDIIQFSRYLLMFEQMGIVVYMQAKKHLFELLSYNFSNINFISPDTIISYDYHMPLLDTAYFFFSTYENLPFQDGYLGVDQKKSKDIENRYFKKNSNKKRIGIVWRTNSPKGESFKKRQERLSRNIKLDIFLKYLLHKNIQLYSLQVNVNDDERTLLKKHDIPSIGDHLINFYDNALIIDNLDVVMAIDTVSTILAGCMGKKVKVLISDNADWRWTASDKHTNWFKTIEIYRKKSKQEWDSVFCEVLQDISLFQPVSDIERILNKAEIYLKQSKLQEVNILCQEVLSKEKENYKALHLMGNLMYKAGDINKSIEFLTIASKINPGDKELRDNLVDIVNELKLTSFEKEYLYFKPYEFNIAKFNIKDKDFNLNEHENELLVKLKKEIDKIAYDRPLYDTLKLYVSLLEKDFYKGIQRFLEFKNKTDLQIFLEKLNILYVLERDLKGFYLDEKERSVILNTFINIFTNPKIIFGHKLLFVKLSIQIYLIKRDLLYKNLLSHLDNVFQQAAKNQTDINNLFFLFESITFMYWGTGYSKKQASSCNKNIIRTFSKYLQKYFTKNNIKPVTKSYNHDKKRVCFVVSKFVFGSYSVGKILYSLLYELTKSNKDNYKIYCYVIDEFDSSYTKKLQNKGIIIKTFLDLKTTFLEKSISIREEAIKDEIDIAIFDMPWSIQTYLMESRIAPKQIYWSHGWYKYSLKNIDKKICHFPMNEKGWEIFGVPVAKEFLIGSKEEKLQAKELKSEILKQYGKDTVILGTIGRLIKIDSDEYLKVIAQIMKENLNTIYIACGEGNSESIKKKIKKYQINEERFIFAGQISPHVYGWVIDIWPDTFPLGQGLSKEEFLAKGKPLVFHRKREDIQEASFKDEFFVANSDEKYIRMIEMAIEDEEYYKKIIKIETMHQFDSNKGDFLGVLK